MPGGTMGAGLGGLGVVGIVLVLVFTVFTGGSGFDVGGVPELPGARPAPDETGGLDAQADLRDFRDRPTTIAARRQDRGAGRRN